MASWSCSSLRVGGWRHLELVPCFNLSSQHFTAGFWLYFDHVCLWYECPHSLHFKSSVSAYFELYLLFSFLALGLQLRFRLYASSLQFHDISDTIGRRKHVQTPFLRLCKYLNVIIWYNKWEQGYNSNPSCFKKSAALIHFGCFICRQRKSLSPIKIISTSAIIAAFNIGWSFTSLISFSAW